MIKNKTVNMEQFQATWEIQDFLYKQLLLMSISKPNSVLECAIK